MTLNKFEGRDVVDTKVKITNSGDGLSAAMDIAPVELRLHQTVQVVLECDVSKITFEPASEGDGVVRIPTLKAGRATLVMPDHELHGATLKVLNDMTEALAREGAAPGSMPGQTTVEGQLADSHEPDEDEGDEPAGSPFDSGDSDQDDLDAELVDLTSRR